jgi:hypothetical protein
MNERDLICKYLHNALNTNSNGELFMIVHGIQTGQHLASTPEAYLCPNCNCYVITPGTVKHCMSDKEWNTYIDSLIEADRIAGKPEENALESWLS